MRSRVEGEVVELAGLQTLEEATAASLLLAIGGRGGAWRHGVATDLIRLHAWICDVHGLPVGEPEHTGDYTPINASPSSRWSPLRTTRRSASRPSRSTPL
ncbi:lasso peptide biosynthesis B2 protein [Kitasatospora sp. SUK 42]|uniref:lasso peptide biosynthesis B2 protein n=1 Tax=Kitasatospora sp. SUK 42 TaxID=1588882 RepID=UPI0020C8CB2A|nr:lasso peptide biosynthesis B2 protein [Kitasatospora sp. SUK 42]